MLLRLLRRSVTFSIASGTPGAAPTHYLWAYDEATSKYVVDENGNFVLIEDPSNPP
jgi:hypothetical protein